VQGIYQIRNTTNGKKYIGSSCNIIKRRYEHKYQLKRGTHGNSHLQRSWDKYGADSFIFEMIEPVTDKEALIQCEQRWLDIVRANGDEVYNIGESVDCPTRGIKFSEARITQMRAISKRQWEDPEYRAKTTAAHIGHLASEETRRKQSEAHKHQKPTRGAIEASRAATKKKWREDEGFRNKMSRLMAERWQNPEFRAKMDKLNRAAKPYPAFIHQETGKIILAGVNLRGMCQRLGLGYSGMYLVSRGKRRANHGWVLLEEE